MAIPSRKSFEIEQYLESAFGRTTAIQQNRCANCHNLAEEFHDDLSRKEFSISGLCQSCQDMIFTDEE